MALSDKQKAYIKNANRRWNFAIGAVRAGKSFVHVAFEIPYRIRQVAGKEGLTVIFGVNGGTIERNVLQPMREIYGDDLVGNIKGSRGVVNLFGEEAWCIGCEKANAVAKIQGTSIKYAYGDEIAKWNKDVFAMIESRLDKEYSCFDGACNPEGPNHWFKQWLDNPKLNAYIQHYVIFDNPFLPKSYVDALCNEYEGTVYYQRYILGKWALAEGLVYPSYGSAIKEAPQGVSFDKYVLSVDYGTENATACLMWAHGAEDDVWYARKEYYYSGRTKGMTKTDEEYADDLERFAKEITDRYEREYRQAVALDDPYATREKLPIIVDPSAASFIATLQKRGVFKVKRADNDVLNGIRETSVAMKDGLIKIDPSLKETIRELGGYAWDDKAADRGIDQPIKQEDHACDAIRYFTKSMHIVQKYQKKRKRERQYGYDQKA